MNRKTNNFENETFKKFYITFFNNSGSFVVGLILGVYFYQIQNNIVSVGKVSWSIRENKLQYKPNFSLDFGLFLLLVGRK